MNKDNPCQQSNLHFEKKFENHKCLHCTNISYWDGYMCLKRKFYLRDYSIKETLESLWYNIGKLFDWYTIREIPENFYTIYEFLDYWIPEKPIKKCKYFEYSDRKYYWTGTTMMDGTKWLPDQDEPIGNKQ